MRAITGDRPAARVNRTARGWRSRWYTLGAIVVVMGCGGGGTEDVTSPPPVVPTLTIEAPPAVAVGATLPASAVVNPQASVVWTSESPLLLRVASDGMLTGLAAGQATIRATSGQATKTASVTVLGAFVDLEVGESHACATTADKALYCWGSNSSSQLGTIAISDSCATSRCSLTPRQNTAALLFAHVNTGASNTCGRTDADEAYCWGDNAEGQLGTTSEQCNGTACSSSPVRAPGSVHFVWVGAGTHYVCGLDATGAAFCWGLNSSGNLGAPATALCGGKHCSVVPTPVAGGIRFRALSVGNLHACGISIGGDAYCWGENSFGQIGVGTGGGSSDIEETPAAVVIGGAKVASIAAGWDHTCALTEAGQAFCWGLNVNGQLGNGTDGSVNLFSARPVAVAGGLTFASITVGGRHTCGLTAAGVAYCWGSNGGGLCPTIRCNTGFLGIGTTADGRNTPTLVARGLVFAQLSAGQNHTCGRTANGWVYCWGGNIVGQLGIGDGSRYNSLSPIGIGVP